MFGTSVVCLCDIPIGDLAFHARKYSDFGLAFRKEFLLARGANPVFYVAEAELGEEPRSLAKHAFSDAGSHVALFRAGLKRFQTLFEELKFGRLHEVLMRLQRTPGHTPMKNDLRSTACSASSAGTSAASSRTSIRRRKRMTLRTSTWSEWRVVGDVNFALDDITRVVLPRSYFKRFRQDAPDYYGQLQQV